MRLKMLGVVAMAVAVVGMSDAGKAGSGPFIGSKACGECHEEQHTSFVTHSKKAHTKTGVQKMLSDLKEEERQACYQCHTTGYGRGGFVSYEETPQFADVGCESCHGPGAEHAEAGGDSAAIVRRPEIKSCEQCHNADRVQNFNFKPLLFSGAH